MILLGGYKTIKCSLKIVFLRTVTTTRQNKVARLLQKELGELFQRRSREYLGNKLATVTVVRISPDLSVAKVYLSIFPVSKNEEPLVQINSHASSIRHEIGNRLRNQLRIIPEFVYYIDDSLDYIENIDNLLKDQP